MSIVFLILKIIGILLLVILCLILLILFHPVFYHVEGQAEENISVQGYFWWFFQILRLEFQWEDQKVNGRLRIFGFTRKPGEEETEEDFVESRIEEYKTEEKQDWTEKLPAEERECPAKESSAEEIKQNRFRKEDETDRKSQNDLWLDSDLKKSSQSPKKKKQKAKTKKKEKKRAEERGIWDRWKDIRQEAADERNRQAISHLWRELCYLLAHLKPRSVQAEISFSTGDPALTGEVTGGLSLFPVIYRYDAHIYPDFLSEEFYIKGSLKMKGHIAVIHLLKMLVCLFLDKNVKRLYYTLRDRI